MNLVRAHQLYEPWQKDLIWQFAREYDLSFCEASRLLAMIGLVALKTRHTYFAKRTLKTASGRSKILFEARKELEK